MEQDQLKCLYGQAKTLYVMQEYDQVLILIDSLLEENSDRRRLLALKVKCLNQMGFYDEARQLLDQLQSEDKGIGDRE